MIKLKFIHLGSRDTMIPPILHYWTGINWAPIPEEVVPVNEYIDGYTLELGSKYKYTRYEKK